MKMKTLICAALISITCLSSTALAAGIEQPPLNSAAFSIFKMIIEGTKPPSAWVYGNPDLNGDGKIDTKDYCILKRKLLNGV
ncbi:MAG TPA: dockerin type I repeat-containing protein [Clostridia bacterium]